MDENFEADETQENENTEKTTVKETEKKQRTNKGNDGKSEGKRTIGTRINAMKGEFRKIVWPTRHQLIKQTATVIVTSIIIGIVVVSFDAVYATALRMFTEFVVK